MRKFTLILAFMLVCSLGLAVVGKRQPKSTPNSEPREIREQRRAARQAAQERKIDSIVLARAFEFSPSSMQQEIAGPTQLLQNPNFEVGIYRGAADIFLPYITGVMPPYQHKLINFTVTDLEKYLTEQTDTGWRVSFQTSLYSASTYTFIFEINSRYGSTVLTIKNTWNNTMQYNGSIMQYY